MLLSWYRRLLNAKNSRAMTARLHRSHRRPSFQPHLEALENRLAPAQLQVVSGSFYGEVPGHLGPIVFSDLAEDFSSDLHTTDFHTHLSAANIPLGNDGGTVTFGPDFPRGEDDSSVAVTYQLGTVANLAAPMVGTPVQLRIVPENGERVGAPVRVPLELFVQAGLFPLGTASTSTSDYGAEVTYQGVTSQFLVGSFSRTESGGDTDTSLPTSLSARIGDTFGLNFWMNTTFDFAATGSVGTSAGGSVWLELRYNVVELTDIRILDATAKSAEYFKNIQIKYSVAEGNVAKPFVFRAYLSRDEKSDPDWLSGDGFPLGSKDLIIQTADARANADGTAKVYNKTYTLDLGYTLRPFSDRRFLIVVADDNEEIAETDETNNDLFVIPLFAKNEKGGFHKSTSRFGFNLNQYSAVDPIRARISRGTADFGTLLEPNDIKAIWEGDRRQFPEHLRDKPPYEGDDWLVQEPLVGTAETPGPVRRLADLINQVIQQGRAASSFYSINDSFDEEGDHKGGSLHYEGRALDLDADNAGLPQLSGLAYLAGFDWVWYEPEKKKINGVSKVVGYHVHVSHHGTQAELSTAAIGAALTWGLNNGLVHSETFYDSLTPLLQNWNTTNKNAFIKKLSNAKPTQIAKSLKGLLLYNAQQLPAEI